MPTNLLIVYICFEHQCLHVSLYTCTIISAHEKVVLVLDELNSVRDSSDEQFEEIWKKAHTMAEAENVELSMPRRCGTQTLRNNVEAISPASYWKRVLFIPYLDHLLIMEFNSRFTHASSVAARTLLYCHHI